MKKYIPCTVFLILMVCAARAENIPVASSLVTLPAAYQNAPETNVPAVSQRWLKNITDPQLNDIIAKVLRYNATLGQMLATINRLKAEYGIARSTLYPNADVGFTAGAFGSQAESQGYYGVSIPVSYELDVWGRLRLARKASFADITVAKEDKMALAMTLVAEAMEVYYRGLYLNEQVRIFEQAVSVAREIKDLKKQRYDKGLIAKGEFLRSEKELSEFSTARADMEAQRIRNEHALKTMMGEYPADGWLQGDFILPEYLAAVLTGLPSELVKQRPDIRAQQSRLESAGFRITAARRDFFPRVTLTASGVKSSLESQQIIDSVFGSWDAFAHISIPLIEGGRKSSTVKVEESRYQQALEEYRDILLQAFKEVEDALAQGNKQVLIVQELKKHEDSLQGIYELNKARYAHGMDSALVAKESRLDVIRALTEKNKAALKLASGRIQLFRALGGEW